MYYDALLFVFSLESCILKLFVDNLTHVDASYLDYERGLVGESWLAGLMLKGQLNQESMICDFGIVKRNTKKWLDNHVDHTLIVPTSMPTLNIKELGQSLEISFDYSSGGKFICSGPTEAFCLVEATAIDPDIMMPWVAERLKDNIPGNIEGISVTLQTELIGGAYYHYTHGLKKHDGNCQRIAHGHRSKIEIYLDHTRQPKLEKQWADQWRDIYIGTEEDLVEKPVFNDMVHQHYYYESGQGKFHITLPETKCYVINRDSTVEEIANHIASAIKSQNPNHTVCVRAYEGVAKGAIAEYE